MAHAFGSTCSFQYNDAIAVCDEETDEPKVMFPAGKTIARKYLERQQMDFVRLDGTYQITKAMLKQSNVSIFYPGAPILQQAKSPWVAGSE